MGIGTQYLIFDSVIYKTNKKECQELLELLLRTYLWQGRFASFTMDENLLVSSCFLNEGISDWSAYLMGLESQEDEVKLERAMKTGRPLGSKEAWP